MRPFSLSAACAALALSTPLPAQNCQNTSVDTTPIDDLGTGTYMGFQGGLYPNGSNDRPASHQSSGLLQAAGVVPRDAAGIPAPDGEIVFLSIGMSNTRIHWSAFMSLAATDPDLNPRLTLVQGAQGGQPAEAIADPAAPYWNFVQDAVQQAGATNAQVQVIWMLEANAGPSDPFPDHALLLRDQMKSIVRIVRDLFPNARLAYMSNRIYAGYATTGLNPEPWAYENAFSVKWLVQDQIQGDPGLNFDPGQGAVEAPWLSWGGYTWADGLVPRSDGLTWECPLDFNPDGTHPSPTGGGKAASIVMSSLKEDPVAEPWFLGGGLETIVTFCSGDGSGTPCPCGNSGAGGSGCGNSGVPQGARLEGTGTTSVSNDTLVLEASEMPSGAVVLFFQGFQSLNGGQGVAFGDGLRCVGGGVIRISTEPVAGGSAQYPGPGEPSISLLGNLPIPGGTRMYQAWYRDPEPSFCGPATFNLSGALQVLWTP